MRAVAVIGAGFGDEGKGHFVDYLANVDSVVVRYNGGAQAGHTVVAEGRRHAFHHFGSGTFRGAPTFLGRHFIVNPLLWDKEFRDLPDGKLMVHPFAMLSTPYDMLVNQFVEDARGPKRHGSTGSGINETYVRCLNPDLETRVGHPVNKELWDKMFEIRDWAEARYRTLTGEEPPERFLSLVRSAGILQHFVNTLTRMNRMIAWYWTPPRTRNLVFEGAQGLLLDEDHRFLPHVTRGKPGLANIIEVCKEVGVTELDVFYAIRTYMTRHGAGPFPTEDPKLKFTDRTNVTNDFQGKLRFGHLDYPLICEAIDKDLAQVPSWLRVNPGIALSHIDQHLVDPRDVQNGLKLPIVLTSHGPDRNDILPVRRQNDRPSANQARSTV